MRNFPFIVVGLLALILFSCNKTKETKSSATVEQNSNTVGGYEIDGDSLLLPELQFEIKLSEKAAARLKKDHESIIVQAYMSGVPRPDTKVQPDEMGELNLGSDHVELYSPGVATFENTKISKAAFESLQEKDFQVLINVFSGRRSTEMNLLDCEIVQEPISKVRGKKLVIRGKLIEE